MKIEILLAQAKGKTIENVAYGNPFVSSQMVFVFTDNTFTTIMAEHDPDGGGVIVPTKLDPLNFGDSELVDSGIVSKEEMVAMRQAYDSKRQSEREARERQVFERLRKKYAC